MTGLIGGVGRVARRKNRGLAKDPLTYAIAQRDADTLTTVRQALKTKNVCLAYQPVMTSGANPKPAFYEGLLRVLDPTGRVIPAKDFIDVVETIEEGRILDCLALEIGLTTLAANPSIRLAINMSARSIGHSGWEQVLDAALASDPTIAERLIIEITESSAMLVPSAVVDFMDRMQRHGTAFALDDFGAGYTSFKHFKDFFFDIVKIDGAFARNIHTDPDNQVLMQALVSIAQQFDMFTVAECVEQAAEADYLATIGIDCLQGYLFAAPTLSPHWDAAASKKKRKIA